MIENGHVLLGHDGRVPTGLLDIDRYLGGGLEPGTMVLVRGPRFAGKHALGQAYLACGLRSAEPVLACLTEAAVHTWKRQLRRLVRYAALDDPGVIRFLDLLPPFDDLDEGPNVTPPGAAATADELAAVVLDAVRRPGNPPRRIVFDSLSVLVHEHGEDAVLSLLARFGSALEHTGATALVLMEEGAVDEGTERLLLRHFDGLWDVDATEEGRSLRLRGDGVDGVSPALRCVLRDGEFFIEHNWGAGRIP